jgi:hypothetical protein
MEDFNAFKPTGKSIFFVSQSTVDYLTKAMHNFKIIASFIDYPQENILPAFINSATRSTVLSKVYLISK